MKLIRILEQQASAAQYYDMGKDFFSFIHTIESSDEQIKNQFEQLIASKIKGKKIRARASRGYKQFEKDYDINVANVSVDDYYDNYVVVVKGSNNKEYFLKPGFKIQVIGPMEPEKPKPISHPPIPPQNQPPHQSQTPSSTPEPQPPSPEQPQKQVQEEEENAQIVRPFSPEEIEKDLGKWFLPLLPNKTANLKLFIPRPGVAKTINRKNVVSYGIVVPVEQIPALTSDLVRQQLQSTSTNSGDNTGVNNIYNLDKFDVNGDKYVIIVRKTTTY